MSEHFPIADPRPFLTERISSLYEEAEKIDPGGPHKSVRLLEEFGEGVVTGEVVPETLCLQTMIFYLSNRKILEGTEAGRLLFDFSSELGQIIDIGSTIDELWETAENQVAQNNNIERAQSRNS